MKMSPSVVGELPHFGVMIALIASHWNKLEQSLGTIYTFLLAGEEPSAFDFFHELIDLNLKEKAFMVAARTRLEQNEIDEATRLFIDIRKAAKSRALVIHGTWCALESKPTSIFLAQSQDLGKTINVVFDYLRSAAKKPDQDHPTRSFDFTPESYSEYKMKDFQDILDRLIQLDQRIGQIGNKILARSVARAGKPPE